MEFGRIYDSLEGIDFTLPPDSDMTIKTLKSKTNNRELSVYVGAPKWSDKTWHGKLYPHKLPENEFLKVYSQNFNTVEFGATFYNIYKQEEIQRWAAQVAAAPGFRFCPKFPQSITHIRRLVNAEQYTAAFYESLSGFGNHIGPLLLQLADNFTPKSFPQLKAYLETLPPAIKVSLEVRHKEWFANSEHRNNFLHLLNELNIGTVISDTSGRRDCAHMDLTTTDAVIRFVGNNLDKSDYMRLDEWVERLSIWAAQGLESVWFFMHQNNERYVPQACVYFIKQLNAKLGTSVKPPQLITD